MPWSWKRTDEAHAPAGTASSNDLPGTASVGAWQALPLSCSLRRSLPRRKPLSTGRGPASIPPQVSASVPAASRDSVGGIRGPVAADRCQNLAWDKIERAGVRQQIAGQAPVRRQRAVALVAQMSHTAAPCVASVRAYLWTLRHTTRECGDERKCGSAWCSSGRRVAHMDRGLARIFGSERIIVVGREVSPPA